MGKKSMSLGIPGPASQEDAAATINTIATAAQAAQIALTAAQNNISHSMRMQQEAEVHHASFIERMAKTDPVEAAAINNITSPGGSNGGGTNNIGAVMAALGQIAARLEK